MEFDIEWLQENNKKQRMDIFYCEGYHHSPVCIIEGNDKKVLISCDGEMKAIFTDNDGDEVYITDFWDLIELGIKTDSDYLKVEDRIEWDFNPWFAAYDITENYDPTLGNDTYHYLEIVEGNLDDTIEKVKKYIETGEQ